MNEKLEQRQRQLKLLHAASQVDVFAYVSINEFLSEVYTLLKEESPSYSYKKYSQDLGFSYTNISWLYINGKRKMSVKSGKSICKALDLKGGARRYAEQLIKLESTVLHQSREKIYKEMFRLKQEFGADSHAKRQLDYFSQWYYPLVREFLAIRPDLDDPEQIANQMLFDVFPKQIEESFSSFARPWFG